MTSGEMRPVPPPDIPGAELRPVAFADLDGWERDDLAAAFATFRRSCAAPVAGVMEEGRPSAAGMRAGLRQICAAAQALGPAPDSALARLFFETHFRPYRVVPQTGGEGFFTAYYEPQMDGALTPSAVFHVPVYARPDDLVTTAEGVGRRVGDQLRPYFDRAAIEDGALAGRGLEIVFLKDPVDLFFMQIQGSGRVRLADGRVLRLGYDGANGHPYTAVGRRLIAAGLVPREEMSMDRIRAYMAAHPEAGRRLRRENRSFVFFKVEALDDDIGPMGAEGVPLTAGRSLAVDRMLHTYGAPVFVEAELPLSAPDTAEPFRRLMIAQDTGSAIVGPARADLFFGAGPEAGEVAGRIRHPGRFTLLAPRFTDMPPEGGS